MKRKKFEAILRIVAHRFEAGETYNEREVNDRQREFSDDVATLRRGLIDHRMMQRDPPGSGYWLV